MKDTMEAKLAPVPSGGFLDKVKHAQRQQMFASFVDFAGGLKGDQVLDLENPWSAHQDSLSQWLAPEQRGAVTTQTFAGAEQRLPFGDHAFDWVFCHDLLAWVGDSSAQLALLQELDRVARKGLFVTAYNRKHPIDFHSNLPLLHLVTGKSAARQPRSPQLLDAPALKELAGQLPGQPHIDVGHLRYGVLKAQLSLQVRK